MVGGESSTADRQLRNAIARRRTNREAFHARPLPKDLARSLILAAQQEGATLSILDLETSQQHVLELVLAAADEQLADPSFRIEILRWVNLRIAEAHDHDSEARRRLGLVMSGAGGHTPEPVDQLALDTALAAGMARMFRNITKSKENRCDRAADSSMLALLTTQTDSKADWLVAGQSLQRVLLIAATKGACASYLNAPIEVDRLRPKIATVFGVKGVPQILLRIGFGAERPPTPRRSMKEILS